jgi:hypothetical protein
MNVILGLLGLAVIVGIVYLLQKISNAASRAFNRNVLFKQSYTRSMEQIRNPTTVLTSLSPSETINAVREGIGAQQTEALEGAGVTVKAISDVHLLISIGNILSENYVCQVSAARHEDATRARLEVLRWTEIDGVPARSKQLHQLKDDFVAALRRVDPGARLLPDGAGSYHDPAPLGSPRVCVEKFCELADQATQKLRCPQCGQFTQFRPG